MVSEKSFCCWYRRALSMASAAWAATVRRPRRVLGSSGRAGSRERSVSVPSTSPGVAIGTTAADEPLRGTARARCTSAVLAEPARGEQDTGRPARRSRRSGGLRCGCGRVRIAFGGLAKARSRRGRARASSASPRGLGIRIAAASRSKSSTTVRATASSVASSERLSVNECEISRARGAAAPSCARTASARSSTAPSSFVALVQPRVLHGDGELARECEQEPLLAFAEGARAASEDGERADRLVADASGTSSARRIPVSSTRPRARRAARPGGCPRRPRTRGARGAERELEQPVRQLVCAPASPREAAAASRSPSRR